MRPVLIQDAEFLFQLSNHPTVRAMSFHPSPIPWKTHCAWLASQLAASHPMYLCLDAGVPCGYVRLQPAMKILKKCLSGDGELSLAVSPTFRGKNVGTFMLTTFSQLCLRNGSVRRLHAWVKQNNPASLRLFDKNHFRRVETASPFGTPAIHFLYPGYEE